MRLKSSHDVYAYGIVCPSRLIVLKKDYPSVGQYAEMASVHDSLGGEAANSAWVLATLGLRVKLEGNWLDDSEASRHALNRLKRKGIEVSGMVQKRFEGPAEWVVASGKERTIFGRYEALSQGHHWTPPRAASIRSARVVCLDPFLGNESLRAARLALRHQVPYVTVDGDYSSELIQQAEAAVISGEFRERRYPAVPLRTLFLRYQKNCQGLVVFTDGHRKLLYARPGGKMRSYAPPRIKPLDTSGAGDSFRAGVVMGVLKRFSDEETVRFSAALACLNCLSFPGVLQSPSYRQVVSFMKSKK